MNKDFSFGIRVAVYFNHKMFNGEWGLQRAKSQTGREKRIIKINISSTHRSETVFSLLDYLQHPPIIQNYYILINQKIYDIISMSLVKLQTKKTFRFSYNLHLTVINKKYFKL